MAYADQPAQQPDQQNQHSHPSAPAELWPANFGIPNLDMDYNEDSEGGLVKHKENHWD